MNGKAALSPRHKQKRRIATVSRAKAAGIHGRQDNKVPRSFLEGMKDLDEGRVVDMETALHEPHPGSI